MLAVSEGPEGRSYQLAYGSELVDFDPARPQLGQKTLYHTTVTEWTDANWDFQIDGDEVPKAQRTYSFESRGGADLVTKIEDGGCSCAAERSYDSAFHVTQSKDNKGVASLMTYNDQGDLTSLTEAAGTADQRIAGYEYAYAATPVFPGQILQKTTRLQSVASPNDDKLTTEINDPATGKLLTRRVQGFRGDGSSLTPRRSSAIPLPVRSKRSMDRVRAPWTRSPTTIIPPAARPRECSGGSPNPTAP